MEIKRIVKQGAALSLAMIIGLSSRGYASQIKTDLSLEEAVKLGIESSEMLELSGLGMELKKVELKENKSKYMKYRKKENSDDPMDRLEYSEISASILGEQNKAEIDTVVTKYAMSELDMKNEYIEKNLEATISKLYYGVLQAKDMLDIKKETLDNLEENYRITKKKFDLGTASKHDLNMIEIDFNNGRLDYAKAEDSYRELVRGLNDILDYPLDTKLNLTTGFKPREAKIDLEADIREAYEKRYDYIISLNDLAIERENFRIIKTAYTPNTHIYKKADIGVRNQELKTKNTRKAIEADIKSKYDRLITSKREIEIMEANVKKAEEGLRVLRVQYDLDLATMLAVNEALAGLNQVKLGQAAAIGDYNVAVIEYETAVRIGSI